MGERADLRRREQEEARRAKNGHPHTHKWLIWTGVIVVGAVALVVGLPLVYAHYLASEAPEPFELSTPEPVVPLGPIDIEGTWTVQEGSEAGYRLDEVLSGQPLTTAGRTSQVTGEIVVEGGLLISGEIVVDVGSIASDEAARDTYFRRAMDASTYPQAVFVLEESADVSVLGTSGAPLTLELFGTLTMHGVSHLVIATLEAQRTADGLEVVGSIPIVLGDFDLDAPDLGFVVVEPEGLVEVLLLFNR
jgi:polyisoprenoid-binding protein YceI